MSTKTIIIGLIVFLIAIVGITFLFTSGQKPVPKTVAYAIDAQERPIAQVDNKFINVGQMKVTDEKNADFTLKNVGTKPLQILNVTSSCHCTFGQILYKEFKSKQYSMGGASDEYVTDIAPGDSATVRAIYIPSIMPVSGIIEREIYITTNDHNNSKIILSIQANVK